MASDKAQADTVVVALSDEEIQDRARELAQVSYDVLELRAERAEKVKDFNDRITKKERHMRDLIEAVHSGQERRPAQMELGE